MRKVSYNEKRRNKCEYCTAYRDGSCKWQKCHYEPEPREYRGISDAGGVCEDSDMTSLEYYIEQVEQFISMLTDDIESGYGTVVTQAKLAVYREVLKHLEEIEQEQSYNSINPELNGDMISRQAVFKIIEDIRDCVSVEGYWAVLERLKKLPPVNPQPCDDAISRQAALDCFTATKLKKFDFILYARAEIKKLPPVNPQQKTGHWIFDEILDKHYYCSECKSMGVDYWDFCPDCGAKMIEPQERSDKEC